MATTDINPNFITAAAVSKEQLRVQLQHIKDSLLAIEAVNNAQGTATSTLDAAQDYKRLSAPVLAAAAASVTMQLPTGYNRYMVEWIDVRGVADGTIGCRLSTDGSTFYSGASDYGGCCLDVNAAGVAASNPGGNALTLCSSQGAAKPGSIGKLFMPFGRNAIKFESCFHRADDVRQRRDGFCATPGTNNLAIQFFCNGGVNNLAIGSTFVVYGAS